MATLSSTPVGVMRGSMFEGSWRRFLPWDNTRTDQDLLTDALIGGLWVGVFLLFFTPAIVTTTTIFPFIVGKAVWSRSLIEVIAGIYVLLAIRCPEYRPTRSILVLLFGLHLAALLIAGIFGSSFNLSFWSSYERMGGIFDLAHWSVLAAVLVFTIRTHREWKYLLGIYLAISWIPIFLGLAERYEYDVAGYFSSGWAGGRIKGAAGNPAFLAGQMAVNTALAVALVASVLGSLRDGHRSLKLGLVAFYGATAVLSFLVLVETETRGTFLGLFIGFASMVALVALTTRVRRIRLVAITAIVAGIVSLTGLFVARDTPLVEDIAERNGAVALITDFSLSGGSEKSRTAALRISVEAFADRPVTGWGGENFEVPFQRYQRVDEFSGIGTILDRAHNKPLDLLATSGLLGFTTYMAVWGWLGYLVLRRVRSRPEDRYFNIAVSGAVVTLFIHNLFLFDTATTLLVFAILVAWVAIDERGNGAGEGSGRDWIRLPANASRSLRWAAPAVVTLVVFASVYGVNWRTFRSAQLITETGSSVEEVAGNLDYFSPLSTFGRERLLNVMSGRWEKLDTDDRISLIPELTEQADIALANEPDNMQLHFATARFYRAAAEDLPELMELARLHTDRGAELGPNTASTELALAAQAEAESDALLSQPG